MTEPAAPVAIVTTTIPLTLEKFQAELILQLRDLGYRVVCVCAPGPGLDRLAARHGVETVAIPMSRDISPRADLVAVRTWIRLVRRLRPTVLVSMTPKSSLLGMIAAWLCRVPIRLYECVGLRLETTTGPVRALLWLVERATIAASTQTVANSPSLRDAVIRLRLARPERIRFTTSDHGVDTSHFVPAGPDEALRTQLGLDPGAPVIGFVGRLTEDKGIATLVEALQIAGRAGVRPTLLVVGPADESDSATWLRHLEQSRLACRVTGFVDDVRPYYALMDVHVLPSLREGFPNAVLEASAMGVATITTDATGCVDSVRAGVTGWIVRAGDAPALAATIGCSLADPDERARRGRAARAWVAADFQPRGVTRDLLRGVPAADRVRD